MAPNKKQNKSPFGLFMAKMKRDDHKCKSMSWPQMVDHCEPIYEKLSPQMKTRFEKLSAFVRNSVLTESQISQELSKLSLTTEDNDWDDDKKPDVTLGFDYSIICDQKLETQQLSLEDEEVDTFAILEEAFGKTENIKKNTIVCICFNILVHTFEDKYYPNEIGLIKFTLEDGIQEVYTKLIANEPPNGYYAKAKEFSEAYHKIPVTNKNNADFESDVQKLFNEMYDFMSASDVKDNRNRKLVFCKAEENAGQSHRYQVVGCLQWLDYHFKSSVDSDKSLIDDFEIVELSDLLFLTIKKYCKNPRPKVLCTESLTRSIYDYYPNMRCGLHCVDDNNYCAMAKVYRSAYLLFDSLFALETKLGLKLKESHKPSEVENDLPAFQTTVTEEYKRVVKTRPQYSYAIKNYFEEVPNDDNQTLKPNIDRSLQTGVGRGRKLCNLLQMKKQNPN